MTVRVWQREAPDAVSSDGLWDAMARLGDMVGQGVRAASSSEAVEAALDRLAVEVAEAELPEVRDLADMVWEDALGWGPGRLAVPDMYALLDRTCRICERINSHPERRLLIVLLSDALADRRRRARWRVFADALEKADLLTEEA